MKRILLIDDEPVTHTMVRNAVKSEIEVVSCYQLSEARELLQKYPNIQAILIDRMLPDGDGISLCGEIRSNESLQHLPIIFLSSKLTEADKLSGFSAGADDYVSKPFSPLELKARILARLRQFFRKIVLGELQVDLNSQTASRLGSEAELNLTRIEFKILSVLIQSPGQIFSRNQLLDRVWGGDTHTTDRVVDTHISHLRKKIQGFGVQLEALRGEGYRIHILPNETKRSAA